MRNNKFILVAMLAMGLNAAAYVGPADALRRKCSEDKFGNMELSQCDAVRLTEVSLNSQQMKLINKAIDEEADSWGDTILEGDVDTNFDDLKIEALQSIRNVKNNSLAGYSVRFSYLGWETSCVKDDSYDRTKPDTFSECKKGRIRAVIFVSSDLKDSEVLVIADLF